MSVATENSKNFKNANRKAGKTDQKAVFEQLIETLTSKYREHGAEEDLLEKTIDHLRESNEAGICLICIEDIERKEAVWSCQKCFCVLHLVCIQRWGKDSIAHLKEAAAAKGFNIPISWCCPKCREAYSEAEFPNRYKCFCGKVTNPVDDLWNAPHSCGDSCGKPLKPECGHYCLLLCHSGPCPPCPKTISSSCFCGNSETRTLRCFSKNWSCGKPCQKLLSCGIHNCPVTCHQDAQCRPCTEPVKVSCKCFSPKELEIKCSDLPTTSISCGKPCKKLLDCCIHICERTCHEGDCGTCEQTCPCGKNRVPCTGQSNKKGGKPCEDTCERLLDCGQHRCEQKCHLGSCGSCLQYVKKTCPCGTHQKESSCSKDFVCQTKCKRIRDCGVHACNKKCCPGDCPPCRSPCGKTLACKNHKCESICHRGPCYPCPVTVKVKCRCGETYREVPCGSERKCKPPECHKPCTRPSKCDHTSIQKHPCHFGDCPKCTLVCSKPLPCGHTCPKGCHTIKKDSSKSKPCPPCVKLIPSKCAQHLSVFVKCCEQDGRCEELCNLTLSCGMHKCLKFCHYKTSPHVCGECRESCNKPRNEGCDHQCPLGCHQGPCPECSLVAKVKCHCDTEEIFVTCSTQNSLSEEERSCKNQCPKKLQCGHRCLSLCHSGDCPELERCRRKVKVTCRCRQYKKEVDCFAVVSKVVECNDTCTPKTPKVKEGTKKKAKKGKGGKNNVDDDGTDDLKNNSICQDSETGTLENKDGNNNKWSVVVISGCIGVVAVLTMWQLIS